MGVGRINGIEGLCFLESIAGSLASNSIWCKGRGMRFVFIQ